MRTIRAGGLAVTALLVAHPAAADEARGVPVALQPPEETEGIEHTLIVGVGGAAELELGDGSFHPGVNVMVEWDAVENWLELELEASVLSTDGGVEAPVSLTVKKPFRLTRRAEFMIGLGPEVLRVSTPTTHATYAGGQAVLDFMFWPTQPIGFWVEPSYDIIFRDGVSDGIGSTGGLLVGW